MSTMRVWRLAATCILVGWTTLGNTAAAEPADAPVAVHIDRSGRQIYLLNANGDVVASEPVGIGRGGLATKTGMSDLITPTGTFTVDLVLTENGSHNAVDPSAVARFSKDPEFARLLSGDPGLKGLFANMNGIDFDRDGRPDRAYGAGYIGLKSDEAVTGPKMRRFSRDRTAYWYAIALHHTPKRDNIGKANSGGCVHLTETMLSRLVEERIVRIGSTVTIADGPPVQP
jgi:hypothetical protein